GFHSTNAGVGAKLTHECSPSATAGRDHCEAGARDRARWSGAVVGSHCHNVSRPTHLEEKSVPVHLRRSVLFDSGQRKRLANSPRGRGGGPRGPAANEQEAAGQK